MEEPVEPEYKEEAELFGAMQEKLAPLVDADLQKRWHAVVRKLDNRVQFGLEPNDSSQHVAAKDVPAFGLKFAKPGLATMLGFPADVEIMGKGIVTAPAPPAAPVRSDGMAFIDDTGRYHPPRGDEGLQVPDGMRNRFIEALPEVEAGCMKCHVSDVDLRPRASGAKFVSAKLDYEKAEAARQRDPAAFKKAHDGNDDLPAVLPDPATVLNPAPTLAEGRALFRKLNCTGCHILDGYGWDRNSGPALDNVTAKVSPEFILTWIRNPRGWREKTRMPNLWPKPLDVASKRPFAPGSPEYVKWDAQMRDETVAVASFLVDRSDNPGSARVLARRRTAEAAQGADQLATRRSPTRRRRARQAGLRVIRLPRLPRPQRPRRGDREAARRVEAPRARRRPHAGQPRRQDDGRLGRLLGRGAEPLLARHQDAEPPPRPRRGGERGPLRRVAEVCAAERRLGRQGGRRHRVRSGEARRARAVRERENGQKMSRVECGEKLIGYYGCFGCHQISGFEKNAPVAPELGGFAKKDVTTLDFGYALADHHLQTTETFATLKLDSPRIYRRDRIELKMGDFDLSPREIRSLVTFLKSLVSSKPKEAYQPDKHPDYAAALDGRQIIDDYNCRACHVIEGHGGDIDGFRANQEGADPQARAPILNGEGMRVQSEWLFTFRREPGKHGIRPWLHPEWIPRRGQGPRGQPRRSVCRPSTCRRIR